MNELTSRALNIDASAADVTAMCAKHSIEISAIEPLHSGGTRVVMMCMDDANVIHRAFRTKLLKSPVVRTHWLRGR